MESEKEYRIYTSEKDPEKTFKIGQSFVIVTKCQQKREAFVFFTGVNKFFCDTITPEDYPEGSNFDGDYLSHIAFHWGTGKAVETLRDHSKKTTLSDKDFEESEFPFYELVDYKSNSNEHWKDVFDKLLNSDCQKLKNDIKKARSQPGTNFRPGNV